MTLTYKAENGTVGYSSTPALENVHTNFGFSCIFLFLKLLAHKRQMDRQMKPVMQLIMMTAL